MKYIGILVLIIGALHLASCKKTDDVKNIADPLVCDSVYILPTGPTDSSIIYYGKHYAIFNDYDVSPSRSRDTTFSDTVIVHRTADTFKVFFWTGHPIPRNIQSDSFSCYHLTCSYPVNDSNVYSTRGNNPPYVRIVGDSLILHTTTRRGCMSFVQYDEIHTIRKH